MKRTTIGVVNDSPVHENSKYKFALQVLRTHMKQEVTPRQSTYGIAGDLPSVDIVARDMNEAFELLKESLVKGNRFCEVSELYLQLFVSSVNNKHRFLLQQQVQSLLQESHFQKYMHNPQFYSFLGKIFDVYPFLVFRLLQSRLYIFRGDFDLAVQLYELYIKFAISRRNDKLLLKYIENEVKMEQPSFVKLATLLTHYPMLLMPDLFTQIYSRLKEAVNNSARLPKERCLKLIGFCDVFFPMKWPASFNKSQIILEFIVIWEKIDYFEAKKHVNLIVADLEVTPISLQAIGLLFRKKLASILSCEKYCQLSCEFVKIVAQKLQKEHLQGLVQKEPYLLAISTLVEQNMLYPELVLVLETLKIKDVHDFGESIETKLTQNIIKVFKVFEKEESQMRGQQQPSTRLITALKTVRLYNFRDFEKVYGVFKQYFLKRYTNRNVEVYQVYQSWQRNVQIKQEMLLLCLHVLGQLRKEEDILRAFMDILDLVGQHAPLKGMMIDFILKNMKEQFFERRVYQAYNCAPYNERLCQDYESNDMNVKIFSLKVLCFLISDAQSEYVPFLKKCYSQLHDRLSSLQRSDSEEKSICLRLIRQMLRHRADLFETESRKLCVVLDSELHRALQFHSFEDICLAEEIFKNFQAIMRQIPHCLTGFFRHIAHYVISLINSKIVKKQLKKVALETFNEMIENCGYVLLPYFHFKNLFGIVREILRADDHYYYYQNELLTLLGRLGYIHPQQFSGMRIATDLTDSPQEIEAAFEVIFGDIGYIRRVRAQANPVDKLKRMVTDQAFYSRQAVTRGCVQIEHYSQHLLLKIVKNMAISGSQIVITQSFKALGRIVKFLSAAEQIYFQVIVLPEVLSLEHLYPAEAAELLLRMIKHQDLKLFAKNVLVHYVPQLSKAEDIEQGLQTRWNWKQTPLLRGSQRTVIRSRSGDICFRGELEILTILCWMTCKQPQEADEFVKDIILGVKRLLLVGWRQEKIFRLCIAIVSNLSARLNPILHLFLPDLNRLLVQLQPQQCQLYFSLLLRLAEQSPGLQLYLPSICEYILQLLKREKGVSYIFTHKVIEVVISLALVFGNKLRGFVDIFHQQIRKLPVHNVFNAICSSYLKRHSNLNSLRNAFTTNELNELNRTYIHIDPINLPEMDLPNSRTHASVVKLIQQFSSNRIYTEEEEDLWLNNLGTQIFLTSNQPLLLACSQLIRIDKVLCHDFFDIGFYFFWESLLPEEVERATAKLKAILMKKELSLRVKQKLIDTIYFVQRCQKPIYIKDKVLSDIAVEVLDQAKSLFYLQREYQNDPEVHGEALINMYATMGEYESAVGLLKSMPNLKKTTKITFYQKLNRHREALKEYDALDDKVKAQQTLLQISMKKEMSEWDSVSNMCNKQLKTGRNRLAPLAIEANINLGKWDQVKSWLPSLQQSHEQYYLWKTMLHIYERNYDEAERQIKNNRQAIYNKICQMFHFSFERSMKGIILLQQLGELEEIVSFCRFQQLYPLNRSEIVLRKEKLGDLWDDRMKGVSKNLEAMQQILLVRSLLFSKGEDIHNWIEYCQLSLKSNQTELCDKTLKNLDTQVIVDQKRRFEIEVLKIETSFNLGQLKDEEAVEQVRQLVEGKKGDDRRYALIIQETYLKCAMWLSEKEYDFTLEKGLKIIDILKNSVKFGKEYIEAWHMMGLTHIKIVELYEEEKGKSRTERRMQTLIASCEDIELSIRKEKEGKESKQAKECKDLHVSQALLCFLKSVSCSRKNHKFFLEDCLKILNIVSTTDETQELITDLIEGYQSIPADGLIEIIPQIIARLDIVKKGSLCSNFIDMMKRLLVYIGRNHPQTLVFPLLFLRKGNNEFRKKLAVDILHEIVEQIKKRDGNTDLPLIYSQANQISEQLCKISLKLSQKFCIFMLKLIRIPKATLAAKNAFAAKYLDFCLSILNESNDLNDLSSLSEYGFILEYREKLWEVVDCLTVFREVSEVSYFRRAEIIISRIAHVNEQNLKFITQIYLQQASATLRKLKQTKVCLFGTYNASSELRYINSFDNTIAVINSKQRPKKIVILGSDNKEYNYLLKGKEDLRLDQRIMQLFSLINKMFHNSSEKEHYSIMGYSITPLSLEIGIISWVENCDTIGDLIKNYREKNKHQEAESIYYEQNICEELCGDAYRVLPKLNKVEIYREVERRISGYDLRNIFWIRAVNSEEWLKHRSCFTRSLAVMSIVGFIIGLGDRHPYNIMVQRDTNKVVHIDFGDCFEVAKMRPQYPEKVPFRLTRMLVKAMEPGRTEGIFKHSCEKILRILRINKESIFVIIEAFRYDPIIGWKLTSKGDQIMLNHSPPDTQLEDSILEDERKRNDEKKQRKQDKREQEDEKEKSDDKKEENKKSMEQERRRTEDEKRKELKMKSDSEFAKHILNVIKNKLNGKENATSTKPMTQEEHVEKLICEAMSPENLVQHWKGWSIFW